MFLSRRLIGVQGINPYLQTHPLPVQRLAQLRSLAQASPYYDNKDPPELQFRHNLIKAKLYGFLNQPETVFNRYRQSNRTMAANYARAIATYRKSGVQVAMPQLDQLIAAKPDWPYFHEMEGQFLLESGNITAAIPSLRQAVSLAPDEPLIRITLAQALLATPNQQDVGEE